MFGQVQSPRHLGLCLYLVRRCHQGRKERTRRLLGDEPPPAPGGRPPLLVDGDQSGAQEAHSSRANRNPRGISAVPLIDKGSREGPQYLMAKNAVLEQQNRQLMRSVSTSELTTSELSSADYSIT